MDEDRRAVVVEHLSGEVAKLLCWRTGLDEEGFSYEARCVEHAVGALMLAIERLRGKSRPGTEGGESE